MFRINEKMVWARMAVGMVDCIWEIKYNIKLYERIEKYF
jgi:hypothetical protein